MTSLAAAADSRGSDGIAIPVPYQPLCTARVLVMARLDGRPLATIDPSTPAGMRAALARSLLDCLLRQVMLEGTFHADPHPGNVLLLADGRLGLLDFGSVGRIDAGLRTALQRLLLALDRGDPAGLADALLEVVERPGELDEPRLERMLGRFLARHTGPGITPDVTMFTDLFRIVSEHGLAVPPEIAAVFRALATMEGTLTQLAPGFDIVAEARRFAGEQLTAQFSPDVLRKTAADELIALLPALRRLPRRPPLPHRPAAPGHPRGPGRDIRRHGRADARPARRPGHHQDRDPVRVLRLLPARHRRDPRPARAGARLPPGHPMTRRGSRPGTARRFMVPW